MKKHSHEVHTPDIAGSKHHEGRHVGGHDEHVHGHGKASEPGMKNMKGTKHCDAQEKFYAHVK